MNIPFRVKLLTSTARTPHRNCESDLWDIFADGFCDKNLLDLKYNHDPRLEENYIDKEANCSFWDEDEIKLNPAGRALIKTGISLELPVQHKTKYGDIWTYPQNGVNEDEYLLAYAVADLRPRSGLALKNGLTVLNAPATIDNSYRKEIGVILINLGHEPYTIKKGDKIAQMLIRPLYPSKMEIVDNIEDTGRGAYGSSGK